MIKEPTVLGVGNIGGSKEKHIVFPISDQGPIENGSARMLYSRWPRLLKSTKVKMGLPTEEDGKTFYPLRCYATDKVGWEKVPRLLEKYLTSELTVSTMIPVGIIVLGSSELDRNWGAKLEENHQAVLRAAEYRQLVIYSDFVESDE